MICVTYRITGRKREITKRSPWASYWPKTFPETIELTRYGNRIVAASDAVQWTVGMYWRKALYRLIRDDGIVVSVVPVEHNLLIDPKVLTWLAWVNRKNEKNGKKNTA